MPDTTTPTTTPTTAPTPQPSRKPTHVAYQVRDIAGREGKKSYWTRVGSAWAHADGQGFNVQLDALPTDGRITLRVASEPMPATPAAA